MADVISAATKEAAAIMPIVVGEINDLGIWLVSIWIDGASGATVAFPTLFSVPGLTAFRKPKLGVLDVGRAIAGLALLLMLDNYYHTTTYITVQEFQLQRRCCLSIIGTYKPLLNLVN